MKTTEREGIIAHEMDYCQHYGHGRGADMVCAAGMDLKVTRVVVIDGVKMGPCVRGHTLPNPTDHCPMWVHRTREQGEARADKIEASTRRMEVVGPVVIAWREKPPRGKMEVVECPACRGRLHLSQAASNGHVWGRCETKGCVSWME